MLFPYWTDAELKHWPFATIVLIVINVFAFMVQIALPPIPVHSDPSETEISEEDELIAMLQNRAGGNEVEELPGWWPYALSHGDGLRPIQWLTSFFIHGGIMHLVGNMIFLWAFGLVVEGRVGPFLFTVLYMGMGIFQNITEQLIFLPFEAMPSLGASSAIYAVMMLAMLWAPQDNMRIFIMLFYRPFFFSIPILILAAIYFLIDFGACLAAGFGMGTGLLHVMGGVVGIGVGIVFLTFQWVDCDDRDIFSMVYEAAGKKRKTKPRKPTKKDLKAKETAEEQRRQRIETIRKSIQMHIDAGNFPAAMNLMKQLHRVAPNASWTAGQMAKLISYFGSEKQWESVVVYSNQFLEKFESDPTLTTTVNTIRINLAKIYVVEKGLPSRALKTLTPINVATLPDRHRQLYHQIVAAAKKQIAEGAIEFED